MKRTALFFILFLTPAFAATTNNMMTPAGYNMMEPYLNSTMRQKLKPKDSEYSTSTNQAMARNASPTNMIASDLVRPQAGIVKQERRVVARSGVNRTRAASANRTQARAAAASAPARSAAPAAPARIGNQTTTARAAATTAVRNNGGRRVVARSRGTSRPTAVTQQTTTPTAGLTSNKTTAECLSSYSECMDNYCHRPNTKYDRCYCSAKLAQMDAEYKPAIDSLLKQIIIMQNGGEIEDGMSQEEINDYWNNTFGSSSMADLDNALNIEWAGTESTVRGQNAFISGDNYCKQHLAGCFYMADNMKSMYRTTIGQDCKKYETNLQKLKYAAEQALANY